MARKKHISKTTHEKNTADSFPTLFFESVSSVSEDDAQKSSKTSRHPKHQTERLIWMWSGVVIVMVVILLTWTSFIGASGALNPKAWFQKDSLIQESRQSLKYYFEKQKQDRENLNTVSNLFNLQEASTASSTPALNTNEINKLKEKIATLQASASSSASTVLPSSPTKK